MRLAVERKKIRINPDFKRVFARFFFYGEERAIGIIHKVLEMPESQASTITKEVLRDFSKRHRKISLLFHRHFERIKYLIEQLEITPDDLSEWKKMLLGSYFTMEYSIESAAIFNPSIVEDPDQGGVSGAQKRVIISFRATGEGHISSLVFRRGIIENNDITICEPGNLVDEAEIIKRFVYKKDQFCEILKEMHLSPQLWEPLMDKLGEKFTYYEIKRIVTEHLDQNNLNFNEQKTFEEILWLADSYIEVKFSFDTDISERVIFPRSKFETKGIEDARFVQFFNDQGESTYYATYTAYDGFNIMPKLIETKDFYHFKTKPLHGEFAIDKNLALFPKKIDGQYAMISRIDGVNTYIMFSENLCCWNNAKILLRPEYYWELVQIGNGGSPIETDEGWLLITHGVGPMRKYCLGAYLLDKKDPTNVIGRLKEPLLIPTEEEREGYVPNVVYTCGAYRNDNTLYIPYAMSDYSSTFGTIPVDKLIKRILENPR